MASVNGFLFTNGLSGKAGNVVFVTMPDGRVYLRPRVIPRNPKTAAQQQTRSFLSLAVKAFSNLTADQYAKWELFAAQLTEEARRQGLHKTVRATDAFTRLAIKYLQIHGGVSVPLLPPTSEFVGDSLVVQVSAATGGVRFDSATGNGPDVTTELLLQPVRSLNNRATSSHFRSRGFHVFPAGGGMVDVPLPRGRYATAIRFVRLSTGQASSLINLGNHQVV